MSDCPVYQVEIVEERSMEVLVAAENRGQAEVLARRLARLEMNSLGCINGYRVATFPIEPGLPEARSGIWVQSRNDGRGGWIHDLGDLPRLALRPDPNQLSLDLGNGQQHPTPPAAACPAPRTHKPGWPEWGTRGLSEDIRIINGLL